MALVSPVASIDETVALVNGVPQGLVATLCSHDDAIRRPFLEGAAAGVMKFNHAPAGVHAEAPFVG